MLHSLEYARLCLAIKLNRLFKDEKGAVDLVVIVVLIGIVVILAIVFRNAIGKLLTSMLQSIAGDAKNAISGAPEIDDGI